MRELTPHYGPVPAVVAALAVGTCARQVRNVQLTPDVPAVIAELWQAPATPRDLFNGPGGEATVTPQQVRWACERMSTLTDRQLSEAFRAGGYTADQTARYTHKIKEKIAQGLQLTALGN